MQAKQWETILTAVAEKIEKLEFDNYCKDVQIEELKNKVAGAEKYI